MLEYVYGVCSSIEDQPLIRQRCKIVVVWAVLKELVDVAVESREVALNIIYPSRVVTLLEKRLSPL